MAGIKISALSPVPSAQVTDVFPSVQGGVTYKTSISQLETLLSTTLTLSMTSQVTGLTAALAALVPLAGGTMTGPLILNTNSPTTALQAASKGYVDTVASGFTVILACAAATTANLNATAAGAGVGATLTNAGAMAAFSVDGYSASVNDRILVKNQTLTQHNGVYVVTTVGSGAANWVLTRATDYDQATEIKPGTLVAVNNGTVNATTSWLETATVVTVDTDPILFSQFTFSPTAFFQIANNLSEGTPATMRTNLGLGTVATKAASDSSKATAAMVNGATTIGHIAVFSDITGTIQDGGAASGTVTSVATSGLATGGTITTTGTITVTAASKAQQVAASSNAVAITPAVQQYHPSAAKVWCRVTFSAGTPSISSSYNVTSVTDVGTGKTEVNFTVNFTTNTYCSLACQEASGAALTGAGTSTKFVFKDTVNTRGVSFADVDATFGYIAFGTQ